MEKRGPSLSLVFFLVSGGKEGGQSYEQMIGNKTGGVNYRGYRNLEREERKSDKY